MESRKALDTGRKNKKTDKSKWQRVENAHEPIIDKDTFYRVQERMELIKNRHLEASKPNPDAPKSRIIFWYINKMRLLWRKCFGYQTSYSFGKVHI